MTDLAAPIRIDAILPTYNRGEQLRNALDSHAKLNIPDGCVYRLIVVDNNSNDQTPAVVQAFIARGIINCHYQFEPAQGLSYARNAGLAVADADIIAFIDDDCYPAEDWLSIMLTNMSGEDAPALIGGSAFLYDEADLPITIMTDPDRKQQTVATLFNGIAGLNFCFQSTLPSQIGNFDVCLGAGTATKSGEDIDFIYRTLQSGKSVVYVPELRVYHHHGRQGEDAKAVLMDGYYLGRGAFYFKYLTRLNGTIVRLAYWELRSLLADLFRKRNTQNLRYIAVLATGAIRLIACRIKTLARTLATAEKP